MTAYRTIIEAMFRIVNRQMETVDFALKPQQLLLDAQFSRRNIIPKGRQGAGVSSYMIGRYVAKCLAEQNRRCVIVSHESDATSRLLARARFILNNLKGDLRPVLGTDNMKAITFPKTNSSLWIGTAGSRSFGRGDNISDLHLSEAAFYDNAEEFTKGIFPAAEHGEITVESTGNGVGNWYHRQCVRAREGRGFKLFFFPSHEMSENVIQFASEADRGAFLRNLDPELEEPDLYGRGISPEFLQWRRERLLVDFEGDLRTFHQEHPISFDECFQSTGFSFFQKVRYEPTEAWIRVSRELSLLKPHPKPGLVYAVGADVSGGVGRDNSVAQIICLDPLEQVGEWVSGHREPHDFGHVLMALGHQFNHAYLNVERNNHGIATLGIIVGDYPLHLIHRGSRGGQATQHILSNLSHYGTLTTEASRGVIIGTMRRLVGEECTIHSEMLRSEMGTFVEQANGKIEADSGCFDDRVMALGMALVVVERAAIMGAGNYHEEPGEPDPWGWEALFGKARRDEPWPIKRELYG
jgi:hypothetical protein